MPLAFYQSIKSSGLSKLFFYATLVGLLTLFVFTGSRGGIIGFCAMVAVLIYYYARRRAFQIVLFSVLIVIVAQLTVSEELINRAATIIHPELEHGGSIINRMSLYKASVAAFFANPITGVGLGNFRLHALEYGAIKPWVAHNTYLEFLAGGGLLTFIPFLLILVDCWRKLDLKQTVLQDFHDLYICSKASFVSILVVSFFISADHKKIFWLLLALISSFHYIANKKMSETVDHTLQ
jgi:O-antigen ligase